MEKRILFLFHLPPPIHGSSVMGLSIKESIIIRKKFKCYYINLLASKNIADSGIFSIKKLLDFLVIWSRTFITISIKSPDLCYLALTTTGKAFFRDLLLVVLLKIFSIRRVYHLHNKGVSRFQHKAIYRFCYKYVFKDADVILLSLRLYPDIQAFVPRANVHICPNGIPDQIPIDKPENHVQRNIPTHLNGHGSKEIVQVLFLSNLIMSKGVFLLLEALEILKKRSILFEGIFIGGEGDITVSQFNERVSELNLNHLAFYQGRKYGKEKNLVFSKADIFAFPTYYSNECFPLVLLEAMSYSLPIVTTREGGIPDIVEDGVTGMLMMKNNVQTLADQLEILIQNAPLRRQMGQDARRKYEGEFTLEIFENKLAGILTQLMKQE